MKKLRIGIIGAGARGIYGFGMGIAKRSDAEVVALVDVNRARIEESGRHAEDGWVRLLRFSLGDVRRADARRRRDHHAGLPARAKRLEAIAHGVPVLIDKPLAATTENCRKIIRRQAVAACRSWSGSTCGTFRSCGCSRISSTARRSASPC